MSDVRRIARVAWEALLVELASYRCLLRWLVRRPDVPEGMTPVGYSRLVTPMLWLWIFGSAVEVVVLDVVLARWLPAARLPLLVVGVWGVLWMLGAMAANRVRPHLLGDAEVVARSGARTVVAVPLGAIAATRAVEHQLPGLLKTLHEDPDGDLLLVGVSSRTNLELVLVGPTRLATTDGAVTVSRVGLWVDEPRQVAELIRLRRSAPAR